MITDINNEDRLVQATFAKHLEQALGWETTLAGGPPKSINHPKHGKPSSTWKYYSPDAMLLGIVCRFEHADGSKDVIPFTHGLDSKSGKTDFLWRGFSEPRPLYGLDRLARQADKIRVRLGWHPGILNGAGLKPKGLHWRTYNRIYAEHLAPSSKFFAGNRAKNRDIWLVFCFAKMSIEERLI